MKKFISCLLTFVLILSLMAPLSVCVSAEDTTVFGTDDYNIDDEDDLLTFGQLLETNTFEGKTIVLTNDITLTQEWNAVYASNVAFYGIFDGQGHTITGLEKPNASGNWGFIPNGGGCTIQNVTFKEVSITSSGCTGTIVGYKAGSGDMTFINVHVQGSLSGSNVLGGFVGATRTYNTVSFTNCSFVGSLTNTSSNYTGGLVGGSGAHITATNCYVNATIEANSYVGGIIGQTGGSGVDTNRAVTVTNCYIDGSITTSAGGQRVGGIGGRLGKAVVTDCVVAMDITASDTTTLVAAFAAQSLMTGTDSTATFTRCVYTGNLTAKGEKVGVFTAQGNSSATITDCILLGSVTPNTLPVGLLDSNSTGSITATGLYCDTTVYTGLANTDGVVNINGMELGGTNGAKNLPDLFSEANRVNWTITDTCPMPSNALKGCNVANLEMLAFQTNPETVTGEYDVRFVGFINSTNYKEAGVIVKIGGKEATIPATHVYNSINEKLGNTTNSVGITKYGYETEDGHFLAIVLTDVPADVTVFTVTPYVVTNDGITVYGVSGTASVTVTQ